MRHLQLPVAATRAGMIAEEVVRSFWPLWTVIFLILAPLMMGWQDLVPLEVFWGGVVVSVIATLTALIWGARRFRIPTKAEAVARVDAALPGRPIAAIADSQAIGSGDAASEAVWRAHMARMAERTKDARAIEPDLRVSDRDPYGLRFVALLFFVTALLFGSLLRVGSVAEIAAGGEQTLATGPVWEGWVEPPAYTGRPSIYLNDVPAGPLRVPEGSQVTLRLYGEVGALTVAETVSGRVEDLGAASDAQQQFTITQSGVLTVVGVNGVEWNVVAIEDMPPEVDLTGEIEADAMGELSQPFSASDDYGVESGTATLALDLTAVDRVHGLVIDPDPVEPLVLDLPMPFTGDRSEFEEFLIENLSEHPLANLPVTLQLEVTDAAGQTGATEPEPLILPGRRFFQPFARAVIEQRRDLMWSKANMRRVSQILRAVSHRPEGLFSNETTYLRLRTIIRRLDNFRDVGLTDEGQAEIVEALWDLAIQLEDGRLADARERLRRAQERLAEAMRNGASDEEIAELMQELREATDEYMRMLAQEAEPNDGTDQADNSGNSQQMSMDELQALMDRIEELMQEGRMAEAQELMEQLNQMMENMRVTQGEGGDGPQTPGQQSMQDLAETLRDQEQLSDDAFRDLQEQFNPGQGQQRQPGQPGQQGQQGQGQQPGQPQGQQGQQPGQPGQGGQQGQGQGVGEDSQSGQVGNGAGGEGDQDARSLAERQRALREELQRQRDGLPNLDGEAGDIARRSLERAEGAMEGAEDALRDGDLPEAIDRQAEAMDALRNGMRELGRALAQNQQAEPGQGSEQGQASGRPVPGQRDPLGREMGNTGQLGTDQQLLGREEINRRAEELLGEIRRRSAEQDRPQVERDYLRRLLDQF
ncbi:TIGR02302 family protein [Cognatiyoonia sp. IB215446]|uniref:TIGR02302 family protein n=1 Tax=Cognatiyoonia sp. IB215446 TaxID=3097355 RepID=UPI002A16C738|nr:TIGR02302 family protein [Cognatiyoonia sp. IB215446]MDX8350055.1 TIGR02302 family protein [Cognatiyoonia sp. IB215446]